jgi:hypothetical protein
VTIDGACAYNETMQPAPRPVTDSPWFWAYLFATAALVALALMGPKFSARQSQIEREFQGRQRAAQYLNRQEPSGPLSTGERTLITLRPLFLGLAAITVAAWIVFWKKRTALKIEQCPGSTNSN